MTTSPAIGDNSGLKAYFGGFIDRVNQAAAAANQWLAKVKVIEDAETATRLQDCVDQLKAEVKAIDADRKKQVDPLIEDQRNINGKAKEITAPLTAALCLLEPKLLAWKQELRRRQDAEIARQAEATRKLQEEAQKAQEALQGAAPTVEDVVAATQAQEKAQEALQGLNQALTAKPTVKGDFSRRASGIRTVWSAQIFDLESALAHYLKIPAARQVILDTLQTMADRDARTIKAVDIGIAGVKGVAEER